MNREQVAVLLAFVEGIERRTFPVGAVDAWLTLLVGVEYEDVMQAAREFFDQPETIKGGIQPGPLRRRASQIRTTRTGSVTRALEAARLAAVPPNEEYLRVRAQLAAKLGDLDRPLASSRAA